MTKESPGIDVYSDRYSGCGKKWAVALLVVWTVLHVFLCVLAYLDLLSYIGVAILVVFGCFGYVPLSHWIDQKFCCGGVVSLHQSVIATWGRASRPPTSTQQSDVRRSIRIQAVTVSAGFAITFFILTVQLYLSGTLEPAPDYVAQGMIVLFLMAAILNLLQLVLYDIMESPKWKACPFASNLSTHFRQRILRYRFWSWHCLMSPIIIALSLVSLPLCIFINWFYGILLHNYYFIPFRTIKEMFKEAQTSPHQVRAIIVFYSI